MDEDFSLRGLILSVFDAGDSPDPAVIAELVAERISPEDRDAAFRQALRVYTQHVIVQARYSVRSGSHPPRDAQPSLATRPDLNGFASAKQAAISADWQAQLRSPVSVDEHKRQWKFFGDCNVADLTVAAAIRDKLAHANQVRADEYRHFAELLKVHDVETVRELPESVLAASLGRRAA